MKNGFLGLQYKTLREESKRKRKNGVGAPFENKQKFRAA
jgi:hypothetical protein